MAGDDRFVGAVVLAAGEATRFGSPKQQLLLPDVLERLLASSPYRLIVVAGAHELDVPDDPRIQVVQATDWHLGPGASLRAGLAELDADAGAAVVVLADGPKLDVQAIQRVIDAWRRRGDPVLAADYGEGRSHPVLLAREVWDGIPDEGARALEPVLVECSDLTSPGDVDTKEDLDRLRND